MTERQSRLEIFKETLKRLQLLRKQRYQREQQQTKLGDGEGKYPTKMCKAEFKRLTEQVREIDIKLNERPKQRDWKQPDRRPSDTNLAPCDGPQGFMQYHSQLLESRKAFNTKKWRPLSGNYPKDGLGLKAVMTSQTPNRSVVSTPVLNSRPSTSKCLRVTREIKTVRPKSVPANRITPAVITSRVTEPPIDISEASKPIQRDLIQNQVVNLDCVDYQNYREHNIQSLVNRYDIAQTERNTDNFENTKSSDKYLDYRNLDYHNVEYRNVEYCNVEHRNVEYQAMNTSFDEVVARTISNVPSEGTNDELSLSPELVDRDLSSDLSDSDGFPIVPSRLSIGSKHCVPHDKHELEAGDNSCVHTMLVSGKSFTINETPSKCKGDSLSYQNMKITPVESPYNRYDDSDGKTCTYKAGPYKERSSIFGGCSNKEDNGFAPALPRNYDTFDMSQAAAMKKAWRTGVRAPSPTICDDPLVPRIMDRLYSLARLQNKTIEHEEKRKERLDRKTTTSAKQKIRTNTQTTNNEPPKRTDIEKRRVSPESKPKKKSPVNDIVIPAMDDLRLNFETRKLPETRVISNRMLSLCNAVNLSDVSDTRPKTCPTQIESGPAKSANRRKALKQSSSRSTYRPRLSNKMQLKIPKVEDESEDPGMASILTTRSAFGLRAQAAQPNNSTRIAKIKFVGLLMKNHQE